MLRIADILVLRFGSFFSIKFFSADFTRKKKKKDFVKKVRKEQKEDPKVRTIPYKVRTMSSLYLGKEIQNLEFFFWGNFFNF
jgi:hypothetical protein